MTSWLTRDQFLSQLRDDGEELAKPAPCPSDFSDKGQSYWIEEYPIDFEEASRTTPIPAEADVVVIGSGITAAATLYTLADRAPGLKAVVLEARGICSGATGRNGGHICRPEGTDLRALIEEVGSFEAARLSHLGTRNRDLMLEAIDRLDIADDVDLKLTGTRVVFASEKERNTYLDELKYAEEQGISLEGHLLGTAALCEVWVAVLLFLVLTH